MRAKFSVLVQSSPRAHSSSCLVGTGSLFRGESGLGRGANIYPYLTSELKKE